MSSPHINQESEIQYLGAISKMTEWFWFISRQAIQHQVIQAYAPNTSAEEAEVDQFYEDLENLLELTPKKDVLFIIGDWNAKVGSQEILGVTSKFGPGVQNEAVQRLTEFCQENTQGIANTLLQQQERWLWGPKWETLKKEGLAKMAPGGRDEGVA